METIRWVQGVIAFVKVAETGSFSRAADALGVSKSHISKTIKSLEEELGIALFSRSTRQIQLTDIGAKFLENCQNSLENLEGAKKNIINLSDTPRGVLRVTLAGVFGENYIAPVVIEMSRKYPDLKIELDFTSRIIDLIDEKFDVAIRFGHLQNSSLIAQKIASRREFICASESYLKQAGILKKPSDLARHNCLGGPLWSFKEKNKSIQIHVDGNLKSNNPRVILQAALSGVGVIRLPGSYVHDDIKKGKLVSLLEEYSEGPKDIWVVTPTRHEQNINVKTFITEVKKSLAKKYSDFIF
jgi:DNA-binding transcriptional LysR family regulator